jgi:hypothetical protein
LRRLRRLATVTVAEAGEPEIILPLTKAKNFINNASSQLDLSPLLEEMRALRQEQARSNTKPTIIENLMDGVKFGTSVAMSVHKIQ